MVPSWAILPAARQLIVQSFRHPNTGKAVVIDEGQRKVEVVSVNDTSASDSSRSAGVASAQQQG